MRISTNNWYSRKRKIYDKLVKVTIGVGGIGIIFAVLLIFFYLLWVVFPIFESPSIKTDYSRPITLEENKQKIPIEYLGIEESGELYYQMMGNGSIDFYDATTNQLAKSENLVELFGCDQAKQPCQISQVIPVDSESKKFAILVDQAQLYFVEIEFTVKFNESQRVVMATVTQIYKNIEITFLEKPTVFTGKLTDENLIIISANNENDQIRIQQFSKNKMTDEWQKNQQIIESSIHADYLFLDHFADKLFVAETSGKVQVHNIADLEKISLIDEENVTPPGSQIDTIEMLLGDISLMIADSKGNISQWFLNRDDNQKLYLAKVRNFELNTAVKFLLPEARRKGMVVITESADVLLMHATAHRILLDKKLMSTDDKSIDEVQYVALSPRANRLAVIDSANTMHWLTIHNPHPEISWSALWGKVWYESYNEPKYIWQSSSADTDFEPKFSLTPLTFGTIKAAFYAMIFSVPLAIMGAIYTAYFMAPRMRQWVKPSIEIMEALPTVILGFLAGLFLAPLVENHLLAIVSMLIILPIGMLVFAWCWQLLPKKITTIISDGWQPLLLVPAIVACMWLAFVLAPTLEVYFFAGDIKAWMLAEFNIAYDQRNALVVGLAMGLAVIPNIFSIAEDAIFNVPRHLTQGSLALGATPWQTLSKVVILTASPGIFSAVMIGLGRAVGETMIVLMATGNTPVMDFSVFQGMRTLSANIAVELPESEVNSSHYRILFLAALVLFILTFIFNTAAEVIRQRLRKRYGNL